MESREAEGKKSEGLSVLIWREYKNGKESLKQITLYGYSERQKTMHKVKCFLFNELKKWGKKYAKKSLCDYPERQNSLHCFFFFLNERRLCFLSQRHAGLIPLCWFCPLIPAA